MNVQLFVEGGGEERQDQQCREGFRKFLTAAKIRKMPRIKARGGRSQAFDAFCTAVRTRGPNDLPLLLVDSEDAVAAGTGVLAHLKQRDGWEAPEGTGADQAFLMVQCMETWLIADRKALREFFGPCWRDNALPVWPALEEVDKARVLAALNGATAACDRKWYEKGRISFEVLAATSPAKVEDACPHARSFLRRLREL